jgi:hypothetical protein
MDAHFGHVRHSTVNGGVETETIFKPVTDSRPCRLERLQKKCYGCMEMNLFKTPGSILVATQASKRYGVVTDVKQKRGNSPLKVVMG